jgi:hypothetical protein
VQRPEPYVDAEGVGHVPIFDRNDDDLRDWTLVDSNKLGWVVANGPWRIHGSGHVIRSVGGRKNRVTIFLARALLGLPPGCAPKILHRNGQLLDNTLQNLTTTESYAVEQVHRHPELRLMLLRLSPTAPALGHTGLPARAA